MLHFNTIGDNRGGFNYWFKKKKRRINRACNSTRGEKWTICTVFFLSIIAASKIFLQIVEFLFETDCFIDYLDSRT